MATRERSRPCAACGVGLSGCPAYLVVGHVRRGRRWASGRFLICGGCYGKDSSGSVSGLPGPAGSRQKGTLWWVGLAGRGEVLPPAPCVACGLVVVRRAEKLMKGVTCSRACRTSLTRIRNGGVGSGHPCGACGQPVTTGRADSAYCGQACRQKAYRRRVAAREATTPDPVAELMEAMVPFVVRCTLGVSQALYKALYRVHTADRHGLDGPHAQAQEEALARLASMNPDRIMIPDTDAGNRLRAALKALHNHHAQP